MRCRLRQTYSWFSSWKDYPWALPAQKSPPLSSSVNPSWWPYVGVVWRTAWGNPWCEAFWMQLRITVQWKGGVRDGLVTLLPVQNFRAIHMFINKTTGLHETFALHMPSWSRKKQNNSVARTAKGTVSRSPQRTREMAIKRPGRRRRNSNESDAEAYTL